MGKFVLAYRGGTMPATPEEGEKMMAAWMSWFAALGDGVVDGGNPFGASTTIASNGGVTTGGAAALTGYSILSADSLDAATKLAGGCPQLASGGTVDVYETFDVG